MKILFYNHTGQVSGAERLLLMILGRLDRRKIDPILICPADGPLSQMAAGLAVPVETLTGLDARFTSRPDRLLRYLQSFFQVMREFRRRVVSQRPDLIHANSIRAGLVATLATVGLGTRIVWHLHDLLPRHPLSSFIRLFALFSVRSRMIAVSQAVADNFRGAVAGLQKRVVVILNAIELEKFNCQQNAGSQFREELQLTNTQLLIGIVGQITPRKGQLELIRAFAQALQEIPHSVLVIVGAPLFNRDDEYARQLHETVRELGIADHVRLTGEREDVPAVMQALDLLVINSTVEPFGLVALEAMACGTPIVAAISGGLPELIQHDQNGWLVRQGDQQALTTSLITLSRQPELRARLGRQGLKNLAERFSAERYLAELQSFYLRHADLLPTVSDNVAAGVPAGSEIRLDIQAGGVS